MLTTDLINFPPIVQSVAVSGLVFAAAFVVLLGVIQEGIREGRDMLDP